MKRDLAKYIEGVPHGLGIRIWLYLYSESKSNGNSLANFKELADLYQVDVSTIKKAFNYKQATKLDLIDTLTETESTVVINFRGTGKEAITKPVKVIKEEKVAPNAKEKKSKSKKKNTDNLLTATEPGALMLIQGDLPMVATNEFDRVYTEQIKRAVIGEYNLFYKSVQASMQLGGGVPFEKVKVK